MIRLKQNDHEPPIGWCYAPFEDDDPNFIVRSGTRLGIIRDVAEVFRANQKSIPPNLDRLIEEWICRRINSSFCTGDDIEGTKRYPNPNYALITAQTGMVLRSVRAGRDRVAPEEAERRAAICAECSENVSSGGCAGCNGLRDWVNNNVSSVLPNARRLYVCRRSAVMAQAQVNLSNAALDHVASQDNFADAPAPCWRKPLTETAPSQTEVQNG